MTNAKDDTVSYPPPTYPGTLKKQQPGAQAGMSTMQPVPLGASHSPLEGREWSHGLFDCFSDYKTCCLSCWCPCMAYSSIRRRYDYLEHNGTPHPADGGPKCSLSAHCLLYSVLEVCWRSTCGMTVPLRSGVRSRYNIKGDESEDCLAAWCCTPCAFTQESRELRVEEGQSAEQA